MKVGISGHQNIQPTTSIAWVEAMIRDDLKVLKATIGVSCLAAGTDQLFARAVLALDRPLEVVIPCARYEEAFGDAQAVEIFRELKARASKTYVLPYREPSEQAFFEAGKRVVQMSDMIVAIWNGRPAAGLGGTADIVEYALRCHKRVFHINPVDLTKRVLGNE